VKTVISSGAGGLSSPQGIQIGVDLSIYVASGGTNQILKYSAHGQPMGVFAELPKHCEPKDIEFGPDTNLFVACQLLGKVIALNANSGQQLGIAAQGGGLKMPTGIAFGPGNTLYVTSVGSNQLLRYAQGGYFQGAVQRLEDPAFDVAFHNGRVFLTSGATQNYAMLTIDGGNLLQFAEQRLHEPTGMVFDPSGSLFVSSEKEVVQFDAKGHFRSAVRPRGYDMLATYITISPRETRRAGSRHDEL
jgi:DNA-binding beta-propeller fold protein YncE